MSLNPASPITSKSESLSKTKVIFDRSGRIIGLTDPWFYPSGLKEAIATDAIFTDDLLNLDDPTNGIFFSVGNFPLLPRTDYFIADDYRTEQRLQLQNRFIGPAGVTGNVFNGATGYVGTAGWGEYFVDEEVQQSTVRPTVFLGSNSTSPLIDTTTKKYGIGSVQFLGINGVSGANSGGITIPSIFATGSTQMFVLDAFVNFNSLDTTQVVVAKRPNPASGATNPEYILYWDSAAAQLRFSYRGAGATSINSNITIYSGTFATGSWQHVAVAARAGSYIRTYFGGTLAGTAGAVTIGTASTEIALGADIGGANGFAGYLDNFRLIIGSTTTIESYYGGATCFVPTAQSGLDNYNEVRYLFSGNGVQGSNFFTVQTPSYASAFVTGFGSDDLLSIRRGTTYGAIDGISAANSYGYAQGLSSGAAWAISKVMSAGLTLSEVKDIIGNAIEYDFIRKLQESITGDGGVTSPSINPFQRLFGLTGNGHTGFYGVTGATSTFYSIIPSRENLTYLANFVTAKTNNAVFGSTIFLAESGGTLHSFTPTNVQELFLDLYDFFNRQEGTLGSKKKIVNESSDLNTINKTTFNTGATQDPPAEAA